MAGPAAHALWRKGRPDTTEAPTLFTRRIIMIFAFVLLLVLAALSIDMLWAPALFCAVAAMHWTASLHLPDPLSPLYAFFIGGLAARLMLELVRRAIARRLG